MNVTPAMQRVLAEAAKRPHGNICPTRGVHAGAQDRLIAGLVKRGLAWGDIPRITEAGRAVVQSSERLRSAAEDVCAYDWSDNDPDAVAAIDALRTELSR